MNGADNAQMSNKVGLSNGKPQATDFRADAVSFAPSGVGEIRRGLPRTNKPASTLFEVISSRRLRRPQAWPDKPEQGIYPMKITAADCEAFGRTLSKAAPFECEDAHLDWRDRHRALAHLIATLPIENSRDAGANVNAIEQALDEALAATTDDDRRKWINRAGHLNAKIADYLTRLDPAVDAIPLRDLFNCDGTAKAS